MNPYTPPKHKATSFNCPNCGAFAHQSWANTHYYKPSSLQSYRQLTNLEVALCAHCKKFSFWYAAQLIYPLTSSAPLPHEALPTEVKRDYLEAANIAGHSPRSAAALLRLAVQKLANDILGANRGDNLNDTIKKLVKNGLPQTVQQALDIVRVTGNNAVHPGVIDLKDDQTTVIKLFELVNLITDYMISKPKQIAELYNTLPAREREKIDKRDSSVSK